jgi:hypothetical protein
MDKNAVSRPKAGTRPASISTAVSTRLTTAGQGACRYNLVKYL